MKIYSFLVFLAVIGCGSKKSPDSGVIHLQIDKNDRNVFVVKDNSYSVSQVEKTNQKFRETYIYNNKEVLTVNCDFESGVLTIKKHSDTVKVRIIVDLLE